MPGGDGTGPMGMGPMSGRPAGSCAGNGMPCYANPAGGRGFWGRGRGRGQGFGFGMGRFGRATMAPARGPAPPVGPTREQELETLKQQAGYLQDVLEDIRKRIDNLGADAAK